MSTTLSDKGLCTKKHMLECAEKIILEEGIEALSMDNVGKKSGMSKGAVMHHFKTKRDLMAALIEAYAEHLDEHLKAAEAMFEGAPDETLIPGYIRWFQEFDADNKGWANIGLSLLVQKVHDPELLKPVKDWYAKVHAHIAALPPERRARTFLALMALEGFFYTHKFGLDLMSAEEKVPVYELLKDLSGSKALLKSAKSE